MAQPAVYLLNSPHHVIYFVAYVPGILEVLAGTWDLENSYSLLQAQVFITKSCLLLPETWSNLHLVFIPRSCCSSSGASSPSWLRCSTPARFMRTVLAVISCWTTCPTCFGREGAARKQGPSSIQPNSELQLMLGLRPSSLKDWERKDGRRCCLSAHP